MPAKSLTLNKIAYKKLHKFPLHIHKKIIASFDILKDNPLIGEKLHGELQYYFKYRLGDYRIVYSFDSEKSIVIVVKIEHRQGVYK